MISSRSTASFACFFFASIPIAQAQAVPAAASGPPDAGIEVIGTRPARPDARPPVGSRIVREPALSFGTIASSNVAGLTPDSGMDPFAGGTKMVSEVTCRSDHPRLSATAACRLLPVQRLMAEGDREGARIALDRFASDETSTDDEQYVAAAMQYQIAVSAGDPLDREDALRAMLSTQAMPDASRPAALRTLVSLALQRNDRAGAAILLVKLLALVPQDTRSLVNLAALRAESGDRPEATALVRRAIEISRMRGEAVPEAWLSFAAAS